MGRSAEAGRNRTRPASPGEAPAASMTVRAAVRGDRTVRCVHPRSGGQHPGRIRNAGQIQEPRLPRRPRERTDPVHARQVPVPRNLLRVFRTHQKRLPELDVARGEDDRRPSRLVAGRRKLSPLAQNDA